MFRHNISSLFQHFNSRSHFFVNVSMKDLLSSPMFWRNISFLHRYFNTRSLFFTDVSMQDLLSLFMFQHKIFFPCQHLDVENCFLADISMQNYLSLLTFHHKKLFSSLIHPILTTKNIFLVEPLYINHQRTFRHLVNFSIFVNFHT
jgi:hypothetical protein